MRFFLQLFGKASTTDRALPLGRNKDVFISEFTDVDKCNHVSIIIYL